MPKGLGPAVGTESTSGHYGQTCGQRSSPPLAIVGWAVRCPSRRVLNAHVTDFDHISWIRDSQNSHSGQNLSESRAKSSPGMISRPVIALAMLIENPMALT